ncbi:hypothetical protein QE435_004865 [Rhizobium sp. SORGH_AS 787]|nr:hypothetical protein [Rhizobium sp. SORGH_AS_0787]
MGGRPRLRRLMAGDDLMGRVFHSVSCDGLTALRASATSLDNWTADSRVEGCFRDENPKPMIDKPKKHGGREMSGSTCGVALRPTIFQAMQLKFVRPPALSQRPPLISGVLPIQVVRVATIASREQNRANDQSVVSKDDLREETSSRPATGPSRSNRDRGGTA